MTKTVTKTKTDTKALKALMQTPVGEVAKAAAKAVPPKATGKTAAAPKAKTLYSFEMTPLGDVLRAYFLALACAQTPGGKLKAGAPFRLWPAVNLRTHLANNRVTRAGQGLWALTEAGVSYFNLPDQQPDGALMEQMLKAVTTGEKPQCYSRTLVAMK